MSADIYNHIPTLPAITSVVVKPSPRIMELFLKPEMLTDDEWAELKLYEFTESEEM